MRHLIPPICESAETKAEVMGGWFGVDNLHSHGYMILDNLSTKFNHNTHIEVKNDK